jgi:hypothetical protein
MKRVYFVKDSCSQKVYTREALLREAQGDYSFELRLKDSKRAEPFYVGKDFAEIVKITNRYGEGFEWLVTIEQLDTNGLFAMCGIKSTTEVVMITAWDVNE